MMMDEQSERQTAKHKFSPGDLVYTHPQDNPGAIKRLPSYAHRTAYLVLSVDHVSDITSEAWYRIMSTSKVTGETKIIKLPENMLSRYEELL
tara:strand:- start:242 stop:517 length:276 start_codon:yes stop_codon:yes gene_type:complete